MHQAPAHRNETALTALLQRIDGAPYPSYKSLKGSWQLDSGHVLHFDSIQGDPFAAPSRIRIDTPLCIPQSLWSDRAGKEACEDWLLRQFGRVVHYERRGSGRSGEIHVYRPGPEVVERTAVRVLNDHNVSFRLQIGLPASGRRIRGHAAIKLLFDDVRSALGNISPDLSLETHVHSIRRQRGIRDALSQHELIAFIENGSILPRQDGVSQNPMKDAVAFQAPSGLNMAIETPWGTAYGLGIRQGVTLIVGGGYHGKSTVLHALSRGHLDHIPGDGREGVVTRTSTVKIRAEEGRHITGVNVSPFLNTLPGGRSTEHFCTKDASGSTSQAAAIVESVEAGAQTLLMDEDTCATNLLVRDHHMRALIPAHSEPITPLVDRIAQMTKTWDVSIIMVVGGMGAYLGVADHVIAMDHFIARDVTTIAKALDIPAPQPSQPLSNICPRVPRAMQWTIRKIRARDKKHITLDKQELDVAAIEQIIDAAHAKTIGHALRFIYEHLINGSRDISQVLNALDAILDDEGVEALAASDRPPGDLIRPRRYEVAAALSRFRPFSVQRKPNP